MLTLTSSELYRTVEGGRLIPSLWRHFKLMGTTDFLHIRPTDLKQQPCIVLTSLTCTGLFVTDAIMVLPVRRTPLRGNFETFQRVDLYPELT
jgi:hypothetical protein